MNFLKYFFMVSSAQKNADKQEYKKLGQDLHKANIYMGNTYSLICLLYFMPKCVELDGVWESCVVFQNEGSGSVTKYECPYFVKGKKCSNDKCDCLRRNLEFTDAYNKAAQLRTQKNNFWKDKFAKVK